MRKNLRKGVRLFEAFNGREPTHVDKVSVKDYTEFVLIGPCLEIAYLADDGKGYRHKFRHSSRPLLAVSADGKQLVLLKGRYQFTDRGIVDK
jgi:hypothetical protein